MAKTKKTNKSKTVNKTNKQKKLVIVESPHKATTIKKYLDKNYEVKASVGHIIDLPKSRFAVNLETLEPEYIIMRDKYKIIKELRESVVNSSEVLLASDPDREGEAIAWHLKRDFENNVLNKYNLEIPIKRVKFNEITENEIKEKIKNPEDIDINLVNSQQSRRVIDRIFGYQLSPLLWKKVKSKLSAGRVQSAALRIICDREEEIENFIPEEYWIITVDYQKDNHKLQAELTRIDGKKAEIKSEDEAKRIENELMQGDHIIKDIKEKNVSKNPSPPLITSTLQQAANTQFGFSTMKTMMIAQELYEGIDLGNIRTGLITYMRTDSTRIAPIAIEKVRDYILKTFGEKYLPVKPNYYSNKKSSQDAHECIRPVSLEYDPEKIKNYLTTDQYKIYSLIWKRFIASQMTPSISKQISIEIENNNKTLSVSESQIIFDGYLRVLDSNKDKKDVDLLKYFKINDTLKLLKIHKEQKFTEPPSRFTEASLVKLLEELGIGRPSTYAPTIFTLTKRYYVKKEGRTLKPTELGKTVNKLLVEYFPDLISNNFTAYMEEELDEVEEGKKDWKVVVKEFYEPFSQTLKVAYDKIESLKGLFNEITDYKCELCGKNMVKKLGKFGPFLACSGWPDCKNTMPLPLGKCPLCKNGFVIEKKGKRKKTFYGCSNYPDCEFVTFLKPANKDSVYLSCPKCGSLLFISKENKVSKYVCLNKECNYEENIEK